MADNNFTIDAVDEETGTVTVTFAVDGKQQRIARLPLDTAAALKESLRAYLKNYKAGLALTRVTVADSVRNLVGKETS